MSDRVTVAFLEQKQLRRNDSKHDARDELYELTYAIVVLKQQRPNYH